jgi:small GTP-binding protein
MQREYKLPEDGNVRYGVNTVRHLRQVKKSELLSREQSHRQKHKQEQVFEYFRVHVDPIIEGCVTFILCAQPIDTVGVMLSYMSSWRNGHSTYMLPEKTQKTSKTQRIYLTTQVSPIITRIVTEISKSRPQNVVAFICDALTKIAEEEKLRTPDGIKTGNGSPFTVASSIDKRPSTAEGIMTPRQSAAKPSNNQVNEEKKMVRPESAPILGLQSQGKHAIQIAMLGLSGAWKTSFINTLQGKATSVRPTMGFRPVTMALGDDLKIRFYDLGGNAKIRDIWEQYYHDVHGYIFVVDSTSSPEELQEATSAYQKAVSHSYLANKPGLILANKQEKPGAIPGSTLEKIFTVGRNSDVQLKECTCLHVTDEEEQVDIITDPRVENGLSWLLDVIRTRFDELNNKVQEDSAKKEAEEARIRLQKERNVLKNKIACGFIDQIDKNAFDVTQLAVNPNDYFGEIDGNKFLAGEIGVDVEALDPIALEVAALIGYQRLPLQMVGSLNVPISKKKTPMSWHSIRDLIIDIRIELGLPPTIIN